MVPKCQDSCLKFIIVSVVLYHHYFHSSTLMCLFHKHAFHVMNRGTKTKPPQNNRLPVVHQVHCNAASALRKLWQNSEKPTDAQSGLKKY